MAYTLAAPIPNRSPEASPQFIQGPVIAGAKSPEVITPQSNQAEAMPAATLDLNTFLPEWEYPTEKAKVSVFKRLGHMATSQTTQAIMKVEGLGVGVDSAGLLLAHAAGLGFLAPAINREALALGVDVAAYNKWMPHGETAEQNRLRKIAGKLGSAAVLATGAVGAQILAPHIAHTVNHQLTHGVSGEYILPLTAKYSAVAGINSLRNIAKGRVSRRR